MTDTGGPAEVELKLRLAPEQVARLVRHPALKGWSGGKPRTERLVSTYFDTPDLRLMRNNVALRVRQVGDRRIQTLKCAPDERDGTLVRREWEREVAGDQPELADIGDRRLRKVLRPEKVERLAALFITDIKRRTWPLQVADSTVELAVDVGEIKGPKGRVAVCEAELELKSGTIDGIYALAKELHKSVPFVVETRTKAERGYALVANTRAKPRRAGVLLLDRDATLGNAFLRIGRNGLTQLRANEACVRSTRDPEGVHQLRVAVRRLRSAFSAFRRLLPVADRARIAGDLRWIARQFAPARDWHVFESDLLGPVRQKFADERALDGFAAAVAARKEAAFRQATVTLESAKYTSIALDLEQWWEGGPWARDEGEVWAEPARRFARDSLRKFHRKLVRLGGRIGELSEPELHELRIRAKKLRYAVEFFRGLYRTRDVEPCLAALSGIQERLGSLNDAVVARALLAGIERQRDPMDAETLARASGIVMGWTTARVETDIKEFPPAWAQFAELKPFWK